MGHLLTHASASVRGGCVVPAGTTQEPSCADCLGTALSLSRTPVANPWVHSTYRAYRDLSSSRMLAQPPRRRTARCDEAAVNAGQNSGEAHLRVGIERGRPVI